jgi:DNA-binding Lrp family transcriptional regulator
MSDQVTVRDALSELRNLINVTRDNAEINLQALLGVVDKARESVDAALKSTEALDKITTQLGFSVILEKAVSKNGPITLSAFPSAADEAAKQRPLDVASKPAKAGRRLSTTSRRDPSTYRDKRIVELRTLGFSQREIARQLHVSSSVVWRRLSKLEKDPLPDNAKQANTITQEVVIAPELESDPKFRYNITSKLAETETKLFKLLKKNYPGFTSPEEFVSKGYIKNAPIASATISRLRAKDVPIESAKQARDRGEDIQLETTGWRLIAND